MYKSSVYVLSVSSVSCISACVCLECLVLHTYVCICVYMSSLCIHVESICLVVSVSSVCHFSAWIYFECCVHMYVYAYISRVSIYVCYIISCICREHRSWVCRVFHTKNQKKKILQKISCLECLKFMKLSRASENMKLSRISVMKLSGVSEIASVWNELSRVSEILCEIMSRVSDVKLCMCVYAHTHTRTHECACRPWKGTLW